MPGHLTLIQAALTLCANVFERISFGVTLSSDTKIGMPTIGGNISLENPNDHYNLLRSEKWSFTIGSSVYSANFNESTSGLS